MVKPLPRNKPTPIAPPIASMVSCRWLRRRRNSCCGGTEEDKSFSELFTSAGSEVPRELSIFAQLLENLAEALDFFGGVVMHERGADCAAIHRQPEAFHKARGVHVTVTNADSCARHFFG